MKSTKGKTKALLMALGALGAAGGAAAAHKIGKGDD
jgi:hypothetical protein